MRYKTSRNDNPLFTCIYSFFLLIYIFIDIFKWFSLSQEPDGPFILETWGKICPTISPAVVFENNCHFIIIIIICANYSEMSTRNTFMSLFFILSKYFIYI